MHRITHQYYAEVIAAVLSCIPEPISRRVGAVDILTNVDPIFAGLHTCEKANHDRSYRTTMHVVYPHQQTCGTKKTTLVLPKLPKNNYDMESIVHEFGHVLHEILHYVPNPKPVSKYAKTNRYEAFAEAFTSWMLYDYAEEPDEKTAALLDDLLYWWDT